MNSQICMIIPFFGSWPTYFNLFLASCRNNPTVDFLFFTDIEKPHFAPSNVKFVHLKLSWFNQKFQEKLEVRTNIVHPYKLCDIKPFYGFLFEEYICNYDFWGFCDIDLILGRVSNFVDSTLLQNNDVISFRKEWISGSLTLFRNTSFINTLFSRDENYLSVLKNAEYMGFDETSLEWNLYRSNDNILNLPQATPNLTRIVKQAEKDGLLNASFCTVIKESIDVGESIFYNNGRIEYKEEEYLLYHYVTEKRRFSFIYPAWKIVPKYFYISQTGFYTEAEYTGVHYLRISTVRRLKGVQRRIIYYLLRAKEKIAFWQYIY